MPQELHLQGGVLYIIVFVQRLFGRMGSKLVYVYVFAFYYSYLPGVNPFEVGKAVAGAKLPERGDGVSFHGFVWFVTAASTVVVKPASILGGVGDADAIGHYPIFNVM
jgi:hypothetical protein